MKLRIGFVGSPYSGKTTTAAHVFAELKRIGYATEFLPEYAREHIRRQRAQYGQVKLNDKDQFEIASTQFDREDDILENSGEDVILVTDGSVVNAYFYMSYETDFHDLKDMVEEYDLVFFARNIEQRETVDGNRVHDAAFSAKIDADMDKFFSSSRGFMNVKYLTGSVDERVETAMKAIGNLLLTRELAKAHRQ